MVDELNVKDRTRENEKHVSFSVTKSRVAPQLNLAS
jgi:hypothetical protein